MGGNFTREDYVRDLFAWLNQVKADRTLPASAFKVAFELSQHTNGEHFLKAGVLLAWPSLQTLGNGIGMSERTARDMVQRLDAHGHVRVEVRHGPGRPSRYTLIIKNWQAPASLKRQPGSSLKRQPPSALGEGNTGSRLHENRQDSVAKSGSRLPTNYSIEPSEERSCAARLGKPVSRVVPDPAPEIMLAVRDFGLWVHLENYWTGRISEADLRALCDKELAFRRGESGGVH